MGILPKSLAKCHSTEFLPRSECILRQGRAWSRKVFSSILLALIISDFFCLQLSGAKDNSEPSSVAANPELENVDAVERAVAGVCRTRNSDPKVTIPIDDMARTIPVPLSDPRVNEAWTHAQSLLTIAKRLVPSAIRRVSIDYGIELSNLSSIKHRVQVVRNIRPDVAYRDNAAWRPSEPDTIRFGSVSLLGLRSDEALIAVLGHELTHAVNGTDQTLQAIFNRVSQRANNIGKSIGFGATMELTCELVGLEVVREYISRTKVRGISSRHRFARALQKDCVTNDQSDGEHLSPRETMRTLITLQPDFIGLLPSETSWNSAKKAGWSRGHKGSKKKLQSRPRGRRRNE